jgi:hypothetical protein
MCSCRLYTCRNIYIYHLDFENMRRVCQKKDLPVDKIRKFLESGDADEMTRLLEN